VDNNSPRCFYRFVINYLWVVDISMILEVVLPPMHVKDPKDSGKTGAGAPVEIWKDGAYAIAATFRRAFLG